MSIKRMLLVSIGMTILSLGFAACAPVAPAATEAEAEEQPAEEVVEINWLEWWDSEWGEDTMVELIARFEAGNPGIQVVRTGVGWV